MKKKMRYDQPGLISLNDALYVSAMCNNGSSDTQTCINGMSNASGTLCNNGTNNDGGQFSRCNNGNSNHVGVYCNNGSGNIQHCINGSSATRKYW